MNQKQTDITTGKQIRHLRTQSGMTQEELAGKLNVTRQALSNWERDVNEPDLNCRFSFFHMFPFLLLPPSQNRPCGLQKENKFFSTYLNRVH